ncbi:MAG: hypothetical protein CSA68_12430 [Rhodobacterales bacterium]|nr:MAG: hypothetical protein CSA68_12430 [Rhodobacterales bacterium]
MELKAIEDIEAPIDVVFRVVSDFEAFERAALRRGAGVSRVNRDGDQIFLISWDIKAKIRGKKRMLKTDLTQFNAPNTLCVVTRIGGLQGDTDIELVALSRTRTRLSIHTELKANSLSARLLLQTARLAKGRLEKRYKLQCAKFAEDIETRYKAGQLS